MRKILVIIILILSFYIFGCGASASDKENGNTIFCADTYLLKYYPSGALKQCEISEESYYKGIKLKSGYIIELYENENIKTVIGSNSIIEYKGKLYDSKINFDEKGNIIDSDSETAKKQDAIYFKDKYYLEYYNSGKLKQCEISEESYYKGLKLEPGYILELYENENIKSVRDYYATIEYNDRYYYEDIKFYEDGRIKSFKINPYKMSYDIDRDKIYWFYGDVDVTYENDLTKFDILNRSKCYYKGISFTDSGIEMILNSKNEIIHIEGTISSFYYKGLDFEYGSRIKVDFEDNKITYIEGKLVKSFQYGELYFKDSYIEVKFKNGYITWIKGSAAKSLFKKSFSLIYPFFSS